MTIPPDAIARAKPWPASRRAALPTLPADQRYSGPLDGVPRVYFNPAKNAATEMPEEVVRSYLADPWLYNDWVWCTGAEDNIRQSELVWVETGEKLSDYFAKLKREKPRQGPASWQLLGPPLILAVMGGIGGGFILGGEPHVSITSAVVGLVLGGFVSYFAKKGLR